MGRITKKKLQKEINDLRLMIANKYIQSEPTVKQNPAGYGTAMHEAVEAIGAEAAPLWPKDEWDKWRQNYWWYSRQGWKAISEMHPNHIENVVLQIEEQPQYFADLLRDELLETFERRHTPDMIEISTLLQASLDLVWIDANPYEFITSSPLYKALKERHDAAQG